MRAVIFRDVEEPLSDVYFVKIFNATFWVASSKKF